MEVGIFNETEDGAIGKSRFVELLEEVDAQENGQQSQVDTAKDAFVVLGSQDSRASNVFDQLESPIFVPVWGVLVRRLNRHRGLSRCWRRSNFDAFILTGLWSHWVHNGDSLPGRICSQAVTSVIDQT